ncbi:hypothetical protein V5799_011360 [Amblyomma americanum]|uniref:Uncharacterized protein n=1 Tax=Amblyomma americanum TaxID=6943 RepID=A0AAQ4EHE2_AMBAM
MANVQSSGRTNPKLPQENLPKPGAQKKRGSHAQQTGPAWPGLRLPVIIAVCSCTVLVSIVVLVLTLLLVTNPSKRASSTSSAPRA